ncbi:MAG: hypothetical protein LBI20_04025 [Holosporales bacterium]|nr:hypothetical protein [Holosporales bacterium]
MFGVNFSQFPKCSKKLALKLSTMINTMFNFFDFFLDVICLAILCRPRKIESCSSSWIFFLKDSVNSS